MISQLALAAVSVVFAAWMPLFVALILIKGWSWSWSWYWAWSWRSSWRPRIAHRFRGHRHGAISSESARRSPRLTAAFSSQSCTQPLHHEQECCKLDEDDLKVLVSHMDGTEGGPPWKLMMEHSTPTYQAWYRDPPLGPTQYRTRTVFENVSPELLRDFFWDDEFRSGWDNMLIFFETLSVCSQTGTMIVRWIRKLPLFCGDREYIIIRRIWEFASGYYCITKGTTYPFLPRPKGTVRVENYYSSWHIRSVKARNAGEQQRASEVLLFHYEDVGLPREVVKMGVRAGMWDMVKKLHAGVQMYSMSRENCRSPSSYALMANVATKISPSAVKLPNSQVIV